MPESARARMGELERAVMDVLWQAEEDSGGTKTLTVREVFEALSPNRALAYTTVMTVLERLTKKDVVTQERTGRAYGYRAREPRAAVVAGVMRSALEDADSDVRRAALVRFVESISAEDAEAMQAALAAVIAVDAAAPRRSRRR